MTKQLKKTGGFSLVELMVVIVILGILVAIAVPSFVGYIERSKVTTAATDAAQLASNLNTLYLSVSGVIGEDKINLAYVQSNPGALKEALSQRNLFPQLSGEYEDVIKYVTFDDDIKMFKALSDSDIRLIMNGG